MAESQVTETRSDIVANKHPTEELRASVPALASLVILGVALVIFTWWGARIVRRRTRAPLPPARPVGDEWLKKPSKQDNDVEGS
jgi:hypothetical protein